MLILFLSILSAYHSIVPPFIDATTMRAPKNSVSITFDDGPSEKYTPAILSILKEKKVHATFFVIGSQIQKKEWILRKEILEGHTIGNHSYTHVLFTKISDSRIISEVLLTDLKILSIVGKYPRYFRFPYGGEDFYVSTIHPGPIIGWNVDAYDWKAKDPVKLAQNIVSQTKSGSIILLHDIKEDTVKALPLIIDGLQKKGFAIVPLENLLAGKIQFIPGVVYRSRYTQTFLGKKSKPIILKTPSTESIIPTKHAEIITEIPDW